MRSLRYSLKLMHGCVIRDVRLPFWPFFCNTPTSLVLIFIKPPNLKILCRQVGLIGFRPNSAVGLVDWFADQPDTWLDFNHLQIYTAESRNQSLTKSKTNMYRIREGFIKIIRLNY